MTTKQYLESTIKDNTVFIDENGVVWNPSLQYADGEVVLVMTCIHDEDNEFIYCCDHDEILFTNKHPKIIMKGSDGYGDDKTLNGNFYEPK